MPELTRKVEENLRFLEKTVVALKHFHLATSSTKFFVRGFEHQTGIFTAKKSLGLGSGGFGT